MQQNSFSQGETVDSNQQQQNESSRRLHPQQEGQVTWQHTFSNGRKVTPEIHERDDAGRVFRSEN